MKRKGTVATLVGGQYGSEGKGVVAKELAEEYGVSVRVGGPNAGHSFVHKGKLWKMQALPCGWVNPRTQLVIGAGAVVSLEVLHRELEAIKEATGEDLRHRLLVDERATVLSPAHAEEEGHTEGELHQKIGSTGEGVGAARRARLRRDPDEWVTASGKEQREEYDKYELTRCLHARTDQYLVSACVAGEDLMLEGTQGCGLSVTHGSWPFVTSADTNAAQLCADAGIPPHWVDRSILVLRTMPIRVAGNSGPLAGETNWDELSKKLGKNVEERTTVTKKVRRIGEWDENLVRKSVLLNAPHEVALTFLDYFSPEDERVEREHRLSERGKTFVRYVESLCRCPVRWVGTGFDNNKGWYFVQRQ